MSTRPSAPTAHVSPYNTFLSACVSEARSVEPDAAGQRRFRYTRTCVLTDAVAVGTVQENPCRSRWKAGPRCRSLQNHTFICFSSDRTLLLSLYKCSTMFQHSHPSFIDLCSSTLERLRTGVFTFAGFVLLRFSFSAERNELMVCPDVRGWRRGVSSVSLHRADGPAPSPGGGSESR